MNAKRSTVCYDNINSVLTLLEIKITKSLLRVDS